MAVSSPRVAASRLRDAINVYCAEQKEKLDQRSHNLLERLVDSPDTAKAFERLKLKGPNEDLSILAACIKTDELAHTFRHRIVEEKEMLARMERLDNSVAELRRFVTEQSKRRSFVDGWRAVSEEDGLRMVQCKLPELAEIERGLDLITSLIEGRRYIAKTTDSVIGTTRKKHETKAAGNAAIWHLAQWVCRVTGKPHQREVADLAQVIFRTAVSVERVRNAMRQRHQQPRRKNRRIAALIELRDSKDLTEIASLIGRLAVPVALPGL
jgi:hypothetical protein